MSGLAFWAEDRWTRPFGYRPGPNEDNPYTLGYHIGQDVGGRAWFDPVPVLVSGMVVQSGRGALIGGYVVVRVSDGTFHTYCHLRTGNLPGYGTQLTAGDDLVPLARSTNPYAGDDYMGSASDGAHCHFVVSTNPATAYSPRAGTVIDPRPIIRAALGGDTAGSSSRPFEEDDMYTDADRARDDQIAALVAYLDPIIKNGEPGVDLSRPRFDNAISAILELRQRFIYRDANGTPTYDLAQLTANEIKPMLLTLIAAVGRPSGNPAAPIDVEALASAIREGLGEDLVAALAKQLTK
ncbi:hypothetical protein IC744_06680 [Microbacterium hominis]|uniref:M23 family metallopeptidase n=1 Tax=Microbacterium hominis TaxID=162426 RepID=UPI00168A6EEF|nr:hypothetical protein [Microbacterium hominis]QOC24846.1 hypothetical protein IC745_10675 [Microbacterium hominis]QOC26035.1 hypothetical protein IC745_01000 [Microbacterium hominis]QOC28899.1 hypothetical protein IC744_00025 [Microbacterium hominis]QOC30006.1 hypothetical protein IC744_06680 [Microbacterium hominis]